MSSKFIEVNVGHYVQGFEGSNGRTIYTIQMVNVNSITEVIQNRIILSDRCLPVKESYEELKAMLMEVSND